METRANYTMVGAFVVFFVVAFVAAILWIARVDFSRNAVEYDIYFTRSVTGLKEGGAVLYRGVPVGSVRTITLDPENVEKVRVTIFVDGKVPIKQDAFASLEIQGITGVAYIQLNGGTSAAPILQSKAKHLRGVIATKSSVFEEVTASLPSVLHQVSKTFEAIQPLFDDENRKAFGESLKNINLITKSLVPEPGHEGNIHDLFYEIKQSIQEVRKLVSELNAMFAENRRSLHAFTGNGLPALTQFLVEGKETLNTIKRVSESLERSPSRFLSNDPRQGVKVP